MNRYFVSNIEKFNIQRAQSTNNLVKNIVQKYKVVDSIKKLCDLIPEKSYGAIWKSVKRLFDSGEILVKEIIDEIAGVKKKMIFLNQDIMDEFLRSRHLDSVRIDTLPEYHKKLDELFKALMQESDDKMADNVQIYILEKLKEIGTSPNEMDRLEKQVSEVDKR